MRSTDSFFSQGALRGRCLIVKLVWLFERQTQGGHGGDVLKKLTSKAEIKTAGRCAPAPRLTFWKPAKSKQKPAFLLRRAFLSRRWCGWRPAVQGNPAALPWRLPWGAPVSSLVHCRWRLSFLHSGCWCLKAFITFRSHPGFWARDSLSLDISAGRKYACNTFLSITFREAGKCALPAKGK